MNPARSLTTGSGPHLFQMPALSPTVLTPAVMSPTVLAPTSIGDAAPVDPLVAYSRDFTGSTDLTGWDIYKSGAATATPGASGLLLVPVQGWGSDYLTAPDPTRSLWYTHSVVDQRDGYLASQSFSTDLDIRARFVVRAANGTDTVPAAGGEYRVAVLAIHDPDRSSALRYVHVGFGTGDGVTGVEVKVTRGPNTTSVYPFASASVDGDVRLVKIGQTITAFHRPLSSGEAITSDIGWTTLFTIVWTDGLDAADDFPSVSPETTTALPSTYDAGIGIYSSTTTPDVSVLCSAVATKTPT